MRAVRWLAIVLGAYLGLAVAFEGFVVFMGSRQAAAGVKPGGQYQSD